MKNIFYSFLLALLLIPAFSFADSIPLNRRVFHTKIINEQQRADRIDGKLDGFIKISNSDEVNLQVTDALFRKVDNLRKGIEKNTALPTNNDKIKYLRFIESLVKNFNNSWRSHKLSPALVPRLVDNFTSIMKAEMKGESIAPYIAATDYEVGVINSEIFKDNIGYKESRKNLFLKYSRLHPDKILSTIGPYINEPFAEELVMIAYRYSPIQIYTYSQATSSPQGRLIRRHPDNRIKTIVQLSEMNNALFYFPLLDDLISGKQTIESISKYVGTDTTKYDSVGYYKLLVRTEIDYYNRLLHRDTPVAMFGVNGLIEQLRTKSIQHFIKPINALHDVSNLAVRFKAIAPLDPQDLYYMMVLGESEIYTSSYRHAFDFMLKRMGKKPHGDSLLMSVNFDHFKKFIKMAAGYNRLDTFLKTMAGTSEQILMKAFIANLERSPSLEDAADVADAYGSIRNPVLLKTMLKYVSDNEQRSIKNNNQKGKKIYNLLKTIFLSSDSTNNIDLSKEIGIPPVYTVENSRLADDTGRIVELVFFYGDEDGKGSYSSFMTSFPASEWVVKRVQNQWVEIKSKKGKPVWIFANLPLDNETDKDAEAQKALIEYLDANGLQPSVVIHRGHSYHLQYTIDQLPSSAKIIMLGSCGGYNNLKQILEYAPDAHIISSKQTGARNVNKPIIDIMNTTLRLGKDIDWRQMWDKLEILLSKASKTDKDTFDDYIPPHRNLGAIFLKVYAKAGGT